MKKLGFGFMRMPLTDPNDQTAIDMPRLEEMVDAFLGAGFTYCDTAWMYHDFMSEPAVGKAVVARHPRDSFAVASKMPVAMNILRFKTGNGVRVEWGITAAACVIFITPVLLLYMGFQKRIVSGLTAGSVKG